MSDIRTHSTLTTGLVSYWDLEEISDGSVAVGRRDRHGSNDLTDNGTVASSLGIISNGAEFVRASAEYLSHPSVIYNTNSGTISAWIKYDSLSATASGIVVDWDVNPYKKGNLYLDSSGYIIFTRGGVTLSTVTSSFIPTAGVTYHILATWESGQPVKLYIDGILDATGVANLVTPNNGVGRDAQIGGYEYNLNFGDYYFDGWIDEIGLWSKVLTTDEITDLYNAGAGLPYSDGSDVLHHKTLSTNLVSYWDMEESSDGTGAVTRQDLHGSNDLNDTATVASGTGKIGHGGDFIRANLEYLTIPDASQTGLDLSGDFSISLWVNPTTLPGDVFWVCKGDVNAGTRDASYWFYTDSSGILRLRISDDGTLNSGHNITFSSPSSTIVTGSLQHVVCTYDASAGTATYHVNDISKTATPSGTIGTSINNSTDRFSIGERESNGTATSTMDGVIDEVGIWSKILTTNEITDLYNSGSGLPYYKPDDVKNDITLTASLEAYWEMEQATAAIATDSHGTNDLTNDSTGTGITSATGIQGQGADFEFDDSESFSIADPWDYQSSVDASFSFWFKPETSSATWHTIWAHSNVNTSIRGGTQVIINDTKVTFYVPRATTWPNIQYTYSPGFTAGTWYHITCMFDGSQAKANILVNSTSISGGWSAATWDTFGSDILDPSETFVIGANVPQTGGFIDGMLDEFTYYTKVLSIGEIRALYGYGTPPVYEAGGAAPILYNALAFCNF